MGDDAEYYMEQQEEEARFTQACEDAALDCKRKPLLCWADGIAYEDEIWSWEPLNQILRIFSHLHRERQIGSDCFVASGIPIESDEEDWDNEHSSSLETNDLREVKLVGELKFYLANSEGDATHEVIVLSRYDTEMLRKEVVRQKSSAKTLKEKMVAEMLEEMVSVIEADSYRNAFVFARKL
ncbi:MAG TPA: hypothetical protein VN844_21100 [Pyrinomonadaceae bacterium]|nr:hypothetical protein [Pyrinomonadaceae bacterium]